ncbi:MAG TPA: ORF6N domain-containing protein [Dongiaceae bacterium]|nr:ORF6N domain-containing protein [Dongiaceae bacterium]
MKTDLLALQAERRILLLRSLRVMFDYDLAELYGVETKALNRAVKRNVERFPDDFMFQLTEEEWDNLKCQVGTSSSTALEPPAAASTWGGRRRSLPYAFTEQGVAMLSSVLRSPRAVQVNIAIMRTFVRLREMLLTNADLARKLADLERKYDFQFKAVFDAIRQLMAPPPPQPPRPEIGFHVKEDAVPYRTRRKPRPLVHHS